MKKLSLIVFFGCVILISKQTKAQNNEVKKEQVELVNASFKVYGNCGMCENRIEKAALSVKGVKAADWNSETKVIKIQYSDPAFAKHNNSVDAVSEKIAEVGHDTQFSSASDEAYNNLHGCCQYERPEAKKEEDHSSHNH